MIETTHSKAFSRGGTVRPKRIDTFGIHPCRITETHDASAPITPEANRSTAAERLAAVPLRLIRFSAVRDRTGLSRSTVWRLERHGAFPKHRRLSSNAVGWLEHEIDEWIQTRTRVA
jgi:prophage regulatory protein